MPGTNSIHNLNVLAGQRYPEVANFAALPLPSLHSGDIFVVTSPTGSIFLFNLKRAGLYRSNGSVWTLLGPEVTEFADTVFTLINNADNAGKIQFDLIALTAARKIIMPDHDVPLISLKTGEYTGDGTTSQGIIGVGFKPINLTIWIKTIVNNTSDGIFETTDVIMDDNIDGGAWRHGSSGPHTFRTNAIISLDADGFTVDDNGADKNPNALNVVYNYLAIG